jgi:hypothetical protein
MRNDGVSNVSDNINNWVGVLRRVGIKKKTNEKTRTKQKRNRKRNDLRLSIPSKNYAVVLNMYNNTWCHLLTLSTRKICGSEGGEVFAKGPSVAFLLFFCVCAEARGWDARLGYVRSLFVSNHTLPRFW